VTPLDTPTAQGHTSPCLGKKTGAGFGSPWSAAMSRNVFRSAAFSLPGVASYGRPWAGSRKARRCSIGTSDSRLGRPPVSEVGLAVQNRNWSAIMMTEAEILLSDPLAIRDREQRLFTCWQAVIDLLDHDKEIQNPERTRELLEFLFEEYEDARNQLLDFYKQLDSAQKR